MYGEKRRKKNYIELQKKKSEKKMLRKSKVKLRNRRGGIHRNKRPSTPKGRETERK